MLAVSGKLQIATQASVQRLLDVLLDRFVAMPTIPGRKPAAKRRSG